MNWIRRNGYMLSDPAGFAINRSLTDGRVVYVAVKLGKPWAARRNDPPGMEPRAWDGSKILHVERDLDPDDNDSLLAGLRRCKDACVCA